MPKFTTIKPVPLDAQLQKTRVLIEETKLALERLDESRARLTRQISEHPPR